MNHLLVIDGNNLVHRYFHARGGLANEAIGFAIGRLRRTQQPTHAVIAWDTPGSTWRHELWRGYKADRPPRPDGLDELFEAVKAQCRAWRLAQASVAGVEADDIIASYAEAAIRSRCEVTIVSSDKDLLQLVRDNPQVRMLDQVRRVLWSPTETRDRFGVWPHSLPDLLALVGDKSDGYAGVPGIGPKTAAPLLELHGGLEQLLERIELVASKSARDRLRTHRETASLCYQLATLRRDIELPIALELATWT